MGFGDAEGAKKTFGKGFQEVHRMMVRVRRIVGAWGASNGVLGEVCGASCPE
jgi:hypothetical protein